MVLADALAELAQAHERGEEKTFPPEPLARDDRCSQAVQQSADAEHVDEDSELIAELPAPAAHRPEPVGTPQRAQQLRPAARRGRGGLLLLPRAIEQLGRGLAVVLLAQRPVRHVRGRQPCDGTALEKRRLPAEDKPAAERGDLRRRERGLGGIVDVDLGVAAAGHG